jgi:SAM-dependent methyltransferase
VELRVTGVEEQLNLDFPRCLEPDFHEDLPGARAAFQSIAESIVGADLTPLARRSPALARFDWRGYLYCSIARMVHAAAALRRRGVLAGRMLDYGSYFGNFALMFARAGFSLDALDSYRGYAQAFDGPRRLLMNAGVRLLDFDDVGYTLDGFDNQYDVVLCMGVIEHVPNTPRLLLESLDRVLAPGGVLIVDTPNLVHLYNRQKFARGESVLADLQAQYETELPFEGHHREYTIPELVWMLRRIGHHRIAVEAFNYSSYGLGTLTGRDVLNHWNMVRDPTMREYLMTSSVKRSREEHISAESTATADELDWSDLIVEAEQWWRTALPPAMAVQPAGVDVEHELHLMKLEREMDRRNKEHIASQESLQHEVNLRDGMLRELHERLVREVQIRDEIIDRLRRDQAWMLSGWRRLVFRRLVRS